MLDSWEPGTDPKLSKKVLALGPLAAALEAAGGRGEGKHEIVGGHTKCEDVGKHAERERNVKDVEGRGEA